MDTTLLSLSNSFQSAFILTFAQITGFLPRIFAAFIILLTGALLGRWIKKLVIKSLEVVQVSKFIKNTPVEAFLENSEMNTKIEQVVGIIVYWLFMLLVFHTTVSVLGLQSLTQVLNRVLAYIPRIFSAALILFLGVLVAGVMEALIKGAIKTVDGTHARSIGKFSSYVTVIIFVLAAISELGIAQDFIMILFVGVTATITLSLGLALGLGSKDTVGHIVKKWHEQLEKDLSEK